MTFWGKLIQYVGRIRYRDRYPSWLFEGDARAHIAPVAHRWCIGRGIDFGAGRWPLVGAHPIDLDTDLQLENVASGTQDFVFSSHALEHVRQWRATLCHFRRVLKPGGRLFLYLPHESMRLWNPESCWGRFAGHVWQPRLSTLLGWAILDNWRVCDYRAGPDRYYSWYIVLEKPCTYA